MKKNELISVIIPTYNREKLIVNSINSVLEQTYQNIEVIVVDDASTDNTEKVIKNINDKRIRYIKLKKNQGACHARNVGIKKANGAYITFQDSDDIFYIDKLEKQYNNIVKNDSDMDFCKICVIDNNKTFVPSEKQEKSIKKKMLIDELANGNFISTQAILIKTDCIKKYYFDEELPRLQDFDLILRIIPNIKVSYTDKVLVDLYRQEDSISKSADKLKKAIMILLRKNYPLTVEQRDNLNNWIFNNNPDYTEKYSELYNKYMQLCDSYNLISEDYNKIINSKRWKIVSRFCNIFRK